MEVLIPWKVQGKPSVDAAELADIQVPSWRWGANKSVA